MPPLTVRCLVNGQGYVRATMPGEVCMHCMWVAVYLPTACCLSCTRCHTVGSSSESRSPDAAAAPLLATVCPAAGLLCSHERSKQYPSAPPVSYVQSQARRQKVITSDDIVPFHTLSVWHDDF
jgi:hypothetical protein